MFLVVSNSIYNDADDADADVYVCYVCARSPATVCLWRSEDKRQLAGAGFFLSPVSSGDCTQGVRLGSKYLYLRSPFSGLHFIFLMLSSLMGLFYRVFK